MPHFTVKIVSPHPKTQIVEIFTASTHKSGTINYEYFRSLNFTSKHSFSYSLVSFCFS